MNSADQAANAMVSNGIAPEGPDGFWQRQSYICTVGSLAPLICRRFQLQHHVWPPVVAGNHSILVSKNMT
jgi:hypothetical protein